MEILSSCLPYLPVTNSIITAQSGDVVGYYTNSRNGNNEGIQLEQASVYNQNIVWYDDVMSIGSLLLIIKFQ